MSFKSIPSHPVFSPRNVPSTQRQISPIMEGKINLKASLAIDELLKKPAQKMVYSPKKIPRHSEHRQQLKIRESIV